tara:strand:- start:990 stop:1439 length:450 start_codon:yes stop_codon:yes gene_type:complete
MKILNYYDSDFIKINIEVINNAEIAILNIKKSSPTDNEWDNFLKIFRLYYEHRLQNLKQKYIMMVNVQEMSLLSLTKLKQFVKILKDNEEIIKECAIYTVFIVSSSLVKQFLNFALTIYKNKKPVFFKTDYDAVYKEIHEQIAEYITSD